MWKTTMLACDAFMPRIPRDIRVLREQPRFQFPADGAGNSRSRHCCRTNRIANILIDTEFLLVFIFISRSSTSDSIFYNVDAVFTVSRMSRLTLCANKRRANCAVSSTTQRSYVPQYPMWINERLSSRKRYRVCKCTWWHIFMCFLKT